MPSRTRVSGPGDIYTEHVIWSLNQNDQVQSSVTKTSSHIMTGLDNPNFHKRRRNGELLSHTPYKDFVHDGEITSTSYDAVRVSDQVHTYLKSGVYMYGSPLAWTFSEAQLLEYAESFDYEILVQGAAAKIYSRGHDTLTFLVELRKTMRLFTGIRENLIKLLKRGSANTKVNDIASLWLEYRYGWRVLYYDMVELTDAVKSINEARTRFSDRVGLSTSDTSPIQSTVPSEDGDLIVDTTVNHRISRRGSITADISPSKFQFNPVTTSWELVRFSFIVDWFIDVGTWLESMSFLALTSNYSASYGFQLNSTKYYVEHTDFNGIRYTGSFHSEAYTEASLKVRVPSSVPKSPQTTVKLDVPKVVDILALLKTSFKGTNLSSR